MIEAHGERSHRLVASDPNLGQDVPYGRDRVLVFHDLRSRQPRTQVTGGAPEVQPGEEFWHGTGGHRVHDGICMTTRAELSSVSTAVQELADRITQIAEGLLDDEREVTGPALFEIERSLRTAQRRLGRLLDRG